MKSLYVSRNKVTVVFVYQKVWCMNNRNKPKIPAFISYTPRFTRVLLCVSLLGALITIFYVAVACYRGAEVKVWNMLLVLGVFLLNAVMNWQALRHAPKENGKPLKHGNPGNEV